MAPTLLGINKMSSHKKRSFLLSATVRSFSKFSERIVLIFSCNLDSTMLFFSPENLDKKCCKVWFSAERFTSYSLSKDFGVVPLCLESLSALEEAAGTKSSLTDPLQFRNILKHKVDILPEFQSSFLMYFSLVCMRMQFLFFLH